MDINIFRDTLLNLYEKATNEKVRAFLLYKLQQLDASRNSPSLYNYMSDNTTSMNRLPPDSGVIYNKDLPITQMKMFYPNQMKNSDEGMIIDRPDKYTNYYEF